MWILMADGVFYFGMNWSADLDRNSIKFSNGVATRVLVCDTEETASMLLSKIRHAIMQGKDFLHLMEGVKT